MDKHTNTRRGIKGFVSIPVQERLMTNILKTDSCWIWTGTVRGNYGQIHCNGSKKLAHRVSYEVFVGAIPDGLELDHLCKNKLCINPAHLEPVSHAENMRRADAGWKNAQKTHCLRGHAFTDENTRKSGGRRVCRECVRLSGQKRRGIGKALAEGRE